MSQQVTLSIPDQLYAPIERTAQATHQPIEAVLLSALEASLPPLEGLPPYLVQELTSLELLEDDALREILLQRFPPHQQQALESLLQEKRSRELTSDERVQLDTLQLEADRLMLRKARAAGSYAVPWIRVPSTSEMCQTLPDS